MEFEDRVDRVTIFLDQLSKLMLMKLGPSIFVL